MHCYQGFSYFSEVGYMGTGQGAVDFEKKIVCETKIQSKRISPF